MSFAYISSYDGMPRLPVADTPRLVSAPPAPNASITGIFNIGGGSSAIEGYLRKIIEKAKLTNRLTEDMIRKYHHAFLHLYEYALRKIQELEDEIHSLRNPVIATVIEFRPQDATAKAEMVQYMIDAMNNGTLLTDELPPNLQP